MAHRGGAEVVEGGRGADGLVPLGTGLHCRTERVVSVARPLSSLLSDLRGNMEIYLSVTFAETARMAN